MATYRQEEITRMKLLPKSKESEPYIRTSLGVLHYEPAPQVSAFENQWGLCSGQPEGCQELRFVLLRVPVKPHLL